MVAPWLMGGGAQKALQGVLRELDPRSVSVVTLFRGSTGLEDLADHADSVVDLAHSRTPLGLICAARDVLRLTAEHDRVYSLMRGSHVVLGLRARTLRRRTSALVCSFHQLPSADEGGSRLSSLRARAESMLARRLTRRADLVTAPSMRAVQEILAKGFADAEHTALEANRVRIDQTSLSPGRLGRIDHVRLAFAGRLTEQKGLDRIPELLRAVGTPVHLRIAGSGPERGAIERALMGIPSHVTVSFEGEVSNVTPLIDWCDAIFMPSRAELNPVFVGEARGRGRGVIASRIPAFVDLAEHGGVRLFSDGNELAVVLDSLTYAEERERLSGEALDAAPSECGESAISRALTLEFP